MSLKSLLGTLQSHELRLKQFDPSSSEQAFQSRLTSKFEDKNKGKMTWRNKNLSHKGYGRGVFSMDGRHDDTSSSDNATKGRGRGKSWSKFRCYNCNQVGHTIKFCKNKRDDSKEGLFMHEDTMFMTGVGQPLSTNQVWYVDSACSHHMTGMRNLFVSLEEVTSGEVRTGDERVHTVHGIGDVLISTNHGEKKVSDVYLVPALKHNLLSVGQLLQKGYEVNFKRDHCFIKDANGVWFGDITMTPNQMFPLDFEKDITAAFSAEVMSDSVLWHYRFGHVGMSSLSDMSKKGFVKGLPPIDHTAKVCEACALGKQVRNPFDKNEAWRARQLLELVHTDVCGPMRTPSIGGSRYVLVFVDDHSRKTWAYFIKEKSQSI